MRHSNATKASVLVREHPALYQLCIEDNGSACTLETDGIGIANMEERVHSLHGNLQMCIRDSVYIFAGTRKSSFLLSHVDACSHPAHEDSEHPPLFCSSAIISYLLSDFFSFLLIPYRAKPALPKGMYYGAVSYTHLSIILLLSWCIALPLK